MITIIFNRKTKVATCGNISARGEDAWLDCCRALVNANHPDGPVEFVDDRGVRCMTNKSLYGCARHYRPLPRGIEGGWGGD
jgi:hypothetical protein